MWLWDALAAGGRQHGQHGGRPGGRSGGLRAWDGSTFVETSWREVAAAAAAAAGTLRRLGVRPGRTVAALLTNTPDTVPGILGVWSAGGTIASLPLPVPGVDRGSYARQLGAVIDALDPPVVLADPHLLALLAGTGRPGRATRSWASLAGGPGGNGGTSPPATPPGDDDPAFIQYSSGSTSEPKGCVLTPRAIAHQVSAIREFTGGRPDGETVSSWLPLSHDMGMFGCLLVPWAHGDRLVLSSPERFLLSPRTWFRDMAEYGVTMTAGTDTALHLATRVQRRAPLADRLRLRVCLVGAERVDATTLRQAVATFGPFGLTPSALMPAYGLAEATLAVTACPASRPPTILPVDGLRLADGEVVDAAPGDPAAVPVVAAGVPCRGVTVTTEDAGRLSQILVSSPSLASGYFADPVRTAAVFTPGGLRTGDLGFLRDGQLYVVGRADDLLSVAGRNVYAREIEGGIDAHDAVRKGCVVLVDTPGDGRRELVLLAELRRRDADYQEFAEHAAAVAMARAGVALAECLFLEKGTLPKTPSGKIQRFRCRQLMAQDALSPLARITLPGHEARTRPSAVPAPSMEVGRTW